MPIMIKSVMRYTDCVTRNKRCSLKSANRDELKKRMADMSAFQKQSAALAEYDEQLIRRLIEKVSIYEDKFYCGIQVRRDGGCK